MVSKKLKRAGDLKGELINFARDRFPELYEQALEEFRWGEEKILILEHEHELINPTDRFALETRLPDGRTIIEVFVSERPGLTDQEREMVLSWQEVIEGMFQIDRRRSDGFLLYNLLNDRQYEVKPNMKIRRFPFSVGDLIHARIVPVDERIYMFSGAISEVPGEQPAVAESLQEFLTGQPALSYKGNPEKIEKGFSILADHYQAFVEHFGSDEVISTGRELPQLHQEFMRYLFDKTGTGAGEEATPSMIDFPKALLEADDVGLLFDQVEGMLLLKGYGQFNQVFEAPDETGSQLTAAQKEVVRGYLEADTISTVPFRRVAARFPDRAQEVFREVLGRPDFDLERDFDDLMMEFKAEHMAVRKYPAITLVGERLSELQNQVRGEKPPEVKDVDRNDPCPCGSGKKYKYCCGH